MRSDSFRKQSEGFGSRMLRRAKSVVNRQPKKPLDESVEQPSSFVPKPLARRTRSMFYEKNSSPLARKSKLSQRGRVHSSPTNTDSIE